VAKFCLPKKSQNRDFKNRGYPRDSVPLFRIQMKAMHISTHPALLLSFVLFSLFHTPILAAKKVSTFCNLIDIMIPSFLFYSYENVDFVF
jgi:site-specific recombinase